MCYNPMDTLLPTMDMLLPSGYTVMDMFLPIMDMILPSGYTVMDMFLSTMDMLLPGSRMVDMRLWICSSHLWICRVDMTSQHVNSIRMSCRDHTRTGFLIL